MSRYRAQFPGDAFSKRFIASWLTLLDRSSLANLRTFPFIKDQERKGLLALHGLHFDIASGGLLELYTACHDAGVAPLDIRL